jgi:hypothetical protein
MNWRFLLILTFFSSSHAQWSTDPTQNLIIGYGTNPELCSDGDGGCYVTYENSIGYPAQLVLERINRYGYKVWSSPRFIAGELEDQRFAKITEDGRGGVLITFSDDSIPPLGGTFRVRVQRVDGSGSPLWGPTGVRVSISETTQGDQTIVSDGITGCIVAWRDTMDMIRSQRIDSAGVRTWGDSGVVVTTSPYDILLSRTLHSGYLVATGTTLKKLGPSGVASWTIQMPFRARRLNSNDREDGVVSGFVSSGNGNIAYVAQSYDSLGSAHWTTPHMMLGDSVVSRFVGYPIAGCHGCLISFGWDQLTSNGTRVLAQMLRPDGRVVFQLGGVTVSGFPSAKTLVGVLPSDSLTTLFTWTDFRSPRGTYAQRLDTLAHATWDTVDVAVALPEFSSVHSVTDGNGGFIVAGSRENSSIRAQQVSRYGNLGQVVTSLEEKSRHYFPQLPILYQNYPNPFNPQTIIRFQLPRAEHIDLTLYNVLGQNVRTLASGVREAGLHSIILEARDLPSGIYLYQLTTPQAILTHKLIILK